MIQYCYATGYLAQSQINALYQRVLSRNFEVIFNSAENPDNKKKSLVFRCLDSTCTTSLYYSPERSSQKIANAHRDKFRTLRKCKTAWTLSKARG